MLRLNHKKRDKKKRGGYINMSGAIFYIIGESKGESKTNKDAFGMHKSGHTHINLRFSQNLVP